MTKITYGYNGQKYWGRAHRTGCQDIRREDWDSGPIETEAESLRELIEEMAGDFIFDNDQQPWTDYLTEVSVAPCLKLPKEA